jgi:hypothetical protein
MAAYDDEHLYSLPYEEVPSHDISYNELTDKPSINGVEIEGAKSSEDYGIVMPVVPTKTSDLTNDSGFITSADVPTKTSQLQNDNGFITSAALPTKTSELTNDSGFITSAALPTKTSDLTNDSGFITSAALPTKTSDLTNDSGFITSADVPTKTSELTNDSNFTNKTYVDNAVSDVNSKIVALNGITIVKNLNLTSTFNSTFTNFITSLRTALTTIKNGLNTGEIVEICQLTVGTIGKLIPLERVFITPSTNINNLNYDWSGISYTNNALKIIDIEGKKVLTMTMTNDPTGDGYDDYSSDSTSISFTIKGIKYASLSIS